MPDKESSNGIYQMLILWFSLQNSTFKFAAKYNNPSHLFWFTIPSPAKFSSSSAKTLPMWHGVCVHNKFLKYNILS